MASSILTDEERAYFRSIGERRRAYAEKVKAEEQKRVDKANRLSMYGSIGAAIGKPVIEKGLEYLFPSAAANAGADAGAGAGAGVGAGAGAGAGVGGAASTTSAMAGMGSAALPIAGAYLAYRGASEGIDNYNKGHGAQQQGVQQMLNPIASGLGDVIGMGDVGKGISKAISFINPLSLPLAVADALGVNFWSGKSKDQLARDQWRGDWKNKGYINDQYMLDVGGKQFDVGAEKDAGGNRLYNVNWEDPEQKAIADSVIPLARILSQGNDKQTSDITGYLTNAISSSGQDPLASSRDLYKKFGITNRQDAANQILDMKKSGLLDENEANAALAEIDSIFGTT